MQPEAWAFGTRNTCLVSPESPAPALFLERILEQVYEKGFLSENERGAWKLRSNQNKTYRTFRPLSFILTQLIPLASNFDVILQPVEFMHADVTSILQMVHLKE